MKNKKIIKIEEKFNVIFPDIALYNYQGQFPAEWLENLPKKEEIDSITAGNNPWLDKRDLYEHYKKESYMAFVKAWIWNYIVLSHQTMQEKFDKEKALAINRRIRKQIFTFREVYWTSENTSLLSHIYNLDVLYLQFIIENNLPLFFNDCNEILYLLFSKYNASANDVIWQLLEKECDSLAESFGEKIPVKEKTKIPKELY